MSRYTYGPVRSRRFGLSLGVDVVPHKWCSLDCTYCQLGPTTRRTCQRASFFPAEEVAADVERAICLGPSPDVITLAGSGEPTLYRDLGELVRRIRRFTRIPLLLITNGTLLSDPDVSKDAALFDFVAPSLDAADAETFARVNGPDPKISLEAMITGLRSFTAGFGGKVFLEILLVADVNDHPGSIQALVEAVGSIRPHRVDLNTVSRPAPGLSAKPVSLEFLRSLEPLFAARCLAVRELPAGHGVDNADSVSHEFQVCRDRVLDSLERRPGTLSDLATALSFPELLVWKVLDDLVTQGHLVIQQREGRTWYVSGRAVS